MSPKLRSLLIFDLEVIGHHPGYLRHLLAYWPEHNTHLVFVVSPELATRHPDVAQTTSPAKVTWQPITAEESEWYETSKRSLLKRTWTEWWLYCRYAKKVQADQGLIMYIDRFQLPMALRFFLPCPTSGIFFRPKFHYAQLTKGRRTIRDDITALRERLLWGAALCHPKLATIFCLDPLAVAPLRRLARGASVVHLPDPVEMAPPLAEETAALRRELGVASDRKVLLLFGMIDQRKGIYQVFEALQQLTLAQQAQLTFLLVGPLATTDREAVIARIDTLCRESALQIVLRDEFIADAAIQSYFALADLVLALYQHHVGMSAVLVRAAAAGKPVLASDYGLMGEVARRHKLGVTVDSTDIATITKKMQHFLAQPTIPAFQPAGAAQFATENSATAFVQLLWEEFIR